MSDFVSPLPAGHSDHLLTTSRHMSIKQLVITMVLIISVHVGSATTYTTTGVGTWDANGAPANPLLSGDIVNVNHAGVFFDWPNTVVLQSGSVFNINNGGNIQLLNLTIDAGATVNLLSGGVLSSVGSITNNSNNVTINGQLTDNSSFVNNGSISGSGTITVSGAASGSGTINGTNMGSIDFDSGPVDLSQPLPVDLIDFAVYYDQGAVQILWSTAAETNNDYFTIERSIDARSWETVIRVSGQGSTNDVHHYKYTDSNYIRGRSYYRLSQTDYDGTSELFRPKTIVVNPLPEAQFAYPNPIQGGEMLTIQGTPLQSWRLLDSYGKIRLTGFFGSNTDQISTQGIDSGMYYLVSAGKSVKISVH